MVARKPVDMRPMLAAVLCYGPRALTLAVLVALPAQPLVAFGLKSRALEGD
jgi:hypothetical protein